MPSARPGAGERAADSQGMILGPPFPPLKVSAHPGVEIIHACFPWWLQEP